MSNEICSSERININDVLNDEKELIYSILFYLSGLIVGSFSFSIFNSTVVTKMLGELYKIASDNITERFFANLSVYLSVFLITVILGMFLVGYPVINIIPLLCGIAISVKISYFFTQYGAKGIGYSLLMLIPEASALITIIIYASQTSSQISKHIQQCSIGKNNNEINIKLLLKRYIIYALAVTFISLINSVLTYLIGGIIKI